MSDEQQAPEQRPVACAVCKQAMYYADNSLHEPELVVTVDVRDGDYSHKHDGGGLFYVHTRCAASWSIVLPDLAPVAQPPEHDLPFDDYCEGKDCRACAGLNCTCQCHAPQVSDAELKAIESRIKTCRQKGGPDAMDTHILTNYVPRLVKDLQTVRAASLQPPSPQSEPLVVREFKTAEEFLDAYNAEAVAAQILEKNQLPVRFTEHSVSARNKALAADIAKAILDAQTRGAELQREVDAKWVENYHECPSTNDYNIAAAIRAAKQQ